MDIYILDCYYLDQYLGCAIFRRGGGILVDGEIWVDAHCHRGFDR